MLDGGDPPVDLGRIQAQRLSDAAMGCWKHGQLATAAAMLWRAVALAPDLAMAHSNLGLVLWKLHDCARAERHLREAVLLGPSNHTFHGNLGVFLSAMGRWAEADEALGRATALAPEGDHGPRWDRALLQLERGDWDAGFAGYEARIPRDKERVARGEPPQYPPFPFPAWRGEDLAGKTLWVRGEQGTGDRIMFARYLATVKRRWPTCQVVACLSEDALFWNYRAEAELYPVGVPLPEADYGVFLASLPGLLGARPDRIEPDPGHIKARVRARHAVSPARLPAPHLPSLKVGIVWTGNPAHTRNAERSIPLELLLPLGENPRVQLYALQVGNGVRDVELLGAGELVCDLGAHLGREGWVGTGLVLLQLDLLVTVDTAVAHLAGALDVPTLVLLPKHADWRWMQSGTATAWYPSLELARQREHGDWDVPIETARERLTALA